MGANASTAVPLYASGQVLDAARLNLTNCGVPVFSGTATRDAAFGSSGEKVLAEGQLCYLEDSNSVLYYDSAAWQSVGSTSAVVQVKSTTKTDTFTMSSTTYADVTGLSVSITPTSASNKIYVIASINFNGDAGVNGSAAQLVRGATAIGIADAAGLRAQASIGGVQGADDDYPGSGSLTFLDSPATTSATTYKIQVKSSAAGTTYVNRGLADTNAIQTFRYVSTITVMEVTP